MLKIKNIIGLSALVLSSSCTPFQPPPPTFSQWYKEGVPLADVKSAMRACGYTNLDGVGDSSSMNDVLKRFYCMKDSGFSRKDKLDLCKQSQINESPICDGRR